MTSAAAGAAETTGAIGLVTQNISGAGSDFAPSLATRWAFVDGTLSPSTLGLAWKGEGSDEQIYFAQTENTNYQPAEFGKGVPVTFSGGDVCQTDARPTMVNDPGTGFYLFWKVARQDEIALATLTS